MSLPTHVAEVLRHEESIPQRQRAFSDEPTPRAEASPFRRSLSDPLLRPSPHLKAAHAGSKSVPQFPDIANEDGASTVLHGLRVPASQGVRGLLHQLPAAAVTLIMIAVYSVTYGSILFNAVGMPHEFAPNGVTFWLLAGVSSQMAVLISSSLPCGLAGGTLEMLPVFHAVDTNIATQLRGEPPEAIIGTVLATSFVTTLGLGLMLVVGAQLGVANYLRAVPLVVLKGALFGVAIFMFQSSIQASVPGSLQGKELLAAWPKWSVAVLLGSGLFIVDEFLHLSIAIPFVFVIVAVFPWLLQLVGVARMEDLAEAGWIFGRGGGQGATSQPLAWYDEVAATYSASLPNVHWLVVLKQAPGMLGIWMTHALCTLMDLKATEIITGVEANITTEIRAVGLGNIFSALSGGCWPIYLPCSSNVSANKLGSTKFVGFLAFAGQIILLFLVKDLVPCLPLALPGATSWWLGMLFMKETIVDISQQHAHKYDIIIVVVMAIVVVLDGFINALLIGLLLAMGLFTMQYSGSPVVIRAAGDARYFRSNVHRPREHDEFLQVNSHKIWVIHVDGHVMFGSSPHLSDEVIAALLGRERGADSVLLNFRGVTGLDYSGALDLVTLGRKAAGAGRRVVLTELSEIVQDTLLRAGVRLLRQRASGAVDDLLGLCYSEHYHEALKLCEDVLLAGAGFSTKSSASRGGCNACRPGIGSTAPLSLAPMPQHGEPQSLGSGGDDQWEVFMMLRDTFGDFLPETDAGTNALAELRKRVRVAEHAEGTTLWEEGEAAGFCVIVVEGELYGFQAAANRGRKRLQEVVTTGGFVGYTALVNNMPYVQTLVVADGGGRCLTVEITKEAFTDFIDSHPAIAVAVLRAFLKRGAFEIRDLSRLMTSSS